MPEMKHKQEKQMSTVHMQQKIQKRCLTEI
jgi:hypothetical protein